eukprot:UN04579
MIHTLQNYVNEVPKEHKIIIIDIPECHGLDYAELSEMKADTDNITRFLSEYGDFYIHWEQYLNWFYVNLVGIFNL